MYLYDQIAARVRRLFVKRAPVTDCALFYEFRPEPDITALELAQVVAKGVGNICVSSQRLRALPADLQRHFQPVTS